MTNLTTGVVMEFTYNHAGIRTKKVKKENGVAVETTEYILNGKNVVGLIHTDHIANAVNKLRFQYDAQGRAALLDFNGILYEYVHNLQGDIIGILDGNGELVVEYRYDAWGKPVSTEGSLTTTLGELNPFRYRGYVWDEETELYYLQKRFYRATITAFLTLDSVINWNAYVYCHNNPVKMRDRDGNEDETATVDCYLITEKTKDPNTDHGIGVYYLPEGSRIVLSEDYIAYRCISISYGGNGVDIFWDDELESYIKAHYNETQILEQSCYSGECVYTNFQTVVSQIIGNGKFKKRDEIRGEKYPHLHSEPYNLQLDRFDFSKYDYNKANCMLFYIVTTYLGGNPTFESIVDSYTEDPSYVYTPRILGLLNNTFKGGKSLADIIFPKAQ